MRIWSERIRDERGAVLVLVALSMVALLGMAALAVDVGNVYTARTEAQRVADAAALAGAGWLAVFPDDGGNARLQAIDYASRNNVQGSTPTVLAEDVDVDLAESTVTVRVLLNDARGGAVQTWFARILGIDKVDVGATATAQAQPVGGDEDVNDECYLPIALPDRWWEDEANAVRADFDDTWDPDLSEKGVKDDVADTYVSPLAVPKPSNPSGYTDGDAGTKVYIRSATGGGGDLNPSWYFPWTPFGQEAALVDDGPGGAEYRSRFTGCMNGSYGIGDVVYTEPGAMLGPTKQGFDELIALDPTASWNETEGCVSRGGTCVTNSDRNKPVPLFDPTLPPNNGRKEFVISNIGYLFVEGEESVPGLGKVFVGRWLGGTLVPGNGGSTGTGSGPGGSTEDPLPKRLRLIR